METLDNNLSNGENLIINGQIKSHLLETAKWGRMLAILGFVGLGLMIILLIFGVSMFNTILSQQPMQSGPSLGGGSMTISFVFFALFMLIYIFPLLYLYKGSVAYIKALNSDNQQELEAGFENYKSLFKFIGIFTIIVFGLYLIIFLGSILLGGLLS